VRGSTPAPDRAQWRFGGNTACVTVRRTPGAGAPESAKPEERQTLFILDAGTGIQELGRSLLAELSSSGPALGGAGLPGLRAHLLFSHFHWDHVQGLPFFEPLYTYGNNFHLFGPRPQGRFILSLQEALDHLLQPPFFPTSPAALHAQRQYQEIGEERFELDGVRVATRRLNHPQGCLGYRLEADGTSVVYASDHEPGFPSFDHAVRELAWDADLLIADAHFTPDELGTRFRGWGHSSWAEAVRIARDANVKNLVLFHHEPARRDDEIDLMLRDARQSFSNTWAASEGAVYSLEPGRLRISTRPRRLSQRHPAQREVILEGWENSHPFAEEAHLENLSFHGAYVLSRHRLALHSRVRVVLDAGGQANGNGRLTLDGFVVRTEPARPPTSGGEARPLPQPSNLLNHNVQRYGVAIHFPGVPDSGVPTSKPPDTDS
jgi:phosphoribosyl 1,2-cyclic phosphodiesterase